MTIGIEPTSVDINQVFHITGTVSPAMPGKEVVLHKVTIGSGNWQVYKATRLSSQSTYDFAVTIKAFGAYGFQVWSGQYASWVASIGVYKWIFLSKLHPVRVGMNAPGNSGCGPATIAGTVYPHACHLSMDTNVVGGHWMEWNVSNKCDLFRATRIGLDGDAPTGAQGNLKISNDRKTPQTLYNKNFLSLNANDPNRTIDISKDHRLHFVATAIDPGQVGGSVGMGEARIHCFGTPLKV